MIRSSESRSDPAFDSSAGPQVEPRSSRQRLIDAAIELFGRQGYAATGVSEIARVGQAPMGSFYHHFPNGKAELAIHAIRTGGARYARLIDKALARPGTPGDRLAAIARATADALERREYAIGCPVATTALDTIASDPDLQAEARAVFDDWIRRIQRALVEAGLTSQRARDLATTAIALIEGAEILARVAHSRRPLEVAARCLREMA